MANKTQTMICVYLAVFGLALMFSSVRCGATIPASGNVFLEELPGNAIDPLDVKDTSASFQATNYSVQTGTQSFLGTCSVEELRALGGHTIGVLHIGSHGGVVNLYGGGSAYGIFTSTKATPKNLHLYLDDLKDDGHGQALGIGSAEVWEADGKVTIEPHYCITPYFIQKYNWIFSDASFVLLQACDGGTNDAYGFRQALYNVGASVVVGWPHQIQYGGLVSSLLFDSMLGTYKLVKYANVSRPLSLIDARTAISALNMKFVVAAGVPDIYPNHSPTFSGHPCTALEPTISAAKIQGTTLALHGEFGIPGGTNTTVSVRGTLATNVKVTTSGLICTVPGSAIGTRTVQVFVQVTAADGRTLQSNTVTVPLPPQTLLVTNLGTDAVKIYDYASGADIGDLFLVNTGGIRGPHNMSLSSDGKLYISGGYSNDVERYDVATGAYIDTSVASGSGGLNNAIGMLFGPDGNLYVSSAFTNEVKCYNSQTGAYIGNFISAGSGGLNTPSFLVFGPDGSLYVGSNGLTGGVDGVIRYDSATGAFLGTFVTSGSGGLSGTNGIAFGPDGNLYVASYHTDEVKRYNGATGAYMDNFVTAGSSGLHGPSSLKFGPDGFLYVASFGSNELKRYNGATGAFIGTLISANSGGLDEPWDFIFR